MVLLVGYHASWNRHRDSIRRHGLLRAEPAINQPFGIYIYREDDAFDHVTYGKERALRCRWTSGNRYQTDVWRVCYCGRAMPDPYVENGLILLQDVPPSHLSLQV